MHATQSMRDEPRDGLGAELLATGRLEPHTTRSAPPGKTSVCPVQYFLTSVAPWRITLTNTPRLRQERVTSPLQLKSQRQRQYSRIVRWSTSQDGLKCVYLCDRSLPLDPYYDGHCWASIRTRKRVCVVFWLWEAGGYIL